MIGPLRLARLAAGDFGERTRRYSFLITMLVMVWGTHAFIPPLDSNYTTVDIQGHRGVYNSHWLGVQLAVLVNSFLGLAGFYLVKNAVDRDRQTGVGQLLAAAPLSRMGYTLAKTLSNWLVLASMLGVVAVCTGLLQIVRGEDTAVNPLAIVVPFALLVLPMFALVSATAVLFEVLPVLRGGIGNIVYFWLWVSGGIMAAFEGRSRLVVSNDPMGIGMVTPSIIAAAARAFPAEKITGEHMSIGINIGGKGDAPLVTYVYGGVDWTPEMVAGRLAWVGVAILIALLAALPFDRFANEGAGAGVRGVLRGVTGGRARVRGTPDGAPAAPDGVELLSGAAALAAAPGGGMTFDTSRLGAAPVVRRFDLFSLVRAELRVALKGYPRVWFLGALGLGVAALFAPIEASKTGLAPMLAIWPMLLWSALGTREARTGTSDLLFSAPRPLSRQLPATWLAGVAIGAAVGAPFGLRLLMVGEPLGAITWLAGMAFVPAFALACGVLTGNSRLFEALYLCWWYVAALNHVPQIDFTGASAARAGPGAAAVYSIAAAGLLAVAWAGRKRQLTQ